MFVFLQWCTERWCNLGYKFAIREPCNFLSISIVLLCETTKFYASSDKSCILYSQMHPDRVSMVKSSTLKGEDLLYKLPCELWFAIFSWLPLQDYVECTRVSIAWFKQLQSFWCYYAKQYRFKDEQYQSITENWMRSDPMTDFTFRGTHETLWLELQLLCRSLYDIESLDIGISLMRICLGKKTAHWQIYQKRTAKQTTSFSCDYWEILQPHRPGWHTRISWDTMSPGKLFSKHCRSSRNSTVFGSFSSKTLYRHLGSQPRSLLHVRQAFLVWHISSSVLILHVCGTKALPKLSYAWLSCVRSSDTLLLILTTMSVTIPWSATTSSGHSLITLHPLSSRFAPLHRIHYRKKETGFNYFTSAQKQRVASSTATSRCCDMLPNN